MCAMKSGTIYLLATMPITLMVLAVTAYGALRNGVASLLPLAIVYALLALLLWLCRLIARKPRRHRP
jgi:hypothetical protein